MPRVKTQIFCDQQTDIIDEIIASCDGDMRGAVKALLLVNERLESDLQHLYAAVEWDQPKPFTKVAIH